MLLEESTFKIGSINNMPLYASELVPENEIFVISKQESNYPTGVVFGPYIEKE
jgi:hypothetical protein